MELPSSSSASLAFLVVILVLAAVSTDVSYAWDQETRNISISCRPVDLAALKGFRECIELPFGNWGAADSECCSWTGVSCSDGRVVRLDLSGQRINGRICDPLADLDRLRFLNLSRNQLSGALPEKLFHMPSLEVLDLSGNQFSGYLHLPVVVNMPLSVRVLDVSDNLLAGQVPTSICDSLKDLLSLNLARNAFYGEFPTNIGNCTALQNLSLEDNHLQGELPGSLFRLQHLRYLELQGNSFSGRIIGNLSNLIVLDISRNSFSGELPDTFASTPKLERFSAGSNRFSGTLPYSLVNSRSVKKLELSNNTFEGGVNVNCSAMLHLAILDLGSNLLDAEIPNNLSTCRKLQTLNLSNNNLTGTIPTSFRELQELSALFLSRTRVHDLHGALQTLQQCKSLSVLILSLCFRNEQMPGQAGFMFHNLSAFAIGNSQLTGSLPLWLSRSRSLRLLDLSWNRLNGDIPQWVGGFPFMFYLALANNSFSGNIPESLTQLPSFIDHSVPQLGTASSIPLLLGDGSGRYLQYNQYWNLPSTLDLSYNKLDGLIWSSFGKLKSLQVLRLDHNHLSGEIPDSLGGMARLEKLNLSHNELSGKIPGSLDRLSFLSALDVSDNKLSGTVPSGGQFPTFLDSSFQGNDGLCGFPLKPCSPPEDHEPQAYSEDEDEDFIFPVAAAVAGGAFGFVVTVGFCFASGWVTKPQRRRAKCGCHR